MSEPKIRLSQISPSATGTDSISGNVTISNDLTVGGNLVVSGNTTTLNVETLLIEDNELILNSNVASTPTLNAQITVNRGSSTNTFLLWDESADKWGWSDDGNNVTQFANALLKTGDTMTGELNVANNLVVTGNVGIGTSNPVIFGGGVEISRESQAGLRVSATGSGTPTGIEIGADTNGRGYIQTVTANAGIQFYTGNASNLVMTLSGDNVGIGTGSPVEKMHINDGKIVVTGDTTTPTTGHAFFYKQSAGATISGYQTLIETGSAGSRQTRVTVDFNGNVGVGTTSPTGKLHIVGKSSTGFNAKFEDNTNSGYCWIQIKATGGSNSSWQIGSFNSGLNFYNDNNSAYRVFFGDNGNVGIGSTSPVYKLDVNGSSGFYDAMYFGPNNGAISWNANRFVLTSGSASQDIALATDTFTDRLTVKANTGYIGIGTTNPQQPFVLVDASTRGIEMGPSGGVGSGAFIQAFTRGTNVYNPFTYYATQHTFYTGTGGSINRTIDVTTDGRVGIGTASPGTIFHSYISSGYAGRFETGTDAQIALISPNTWAGIFFNDSSGSDHMWFWGGTGTFSIGGGGSNANSGKKLHIDGGTSIGSNMDNIAMPTNGLLVEGVVRAGPNWSAGDLQLSGLLSGYSADVYPTLKTSGTTIYFDAAGVYTGYISSNSGFIDVSDISLKTNIVPISNAMSIVENLEGVRYAWKDGRDDFASHAGFIAQQVQEFLPEAVTASGPGLLGVYSPSIVAVLVQAVKELKAEIDLLKNNP